MIDASAIEYIPIAGDIASFAVDIIENPNEVWKTIAIILLILVGVGLIGMYVFYSHQKEKQEQEAFFTEFELSKDEMTILHRRFSVESTPTWRGWYDDSKLDMEDWPDYSYYKIKATDDTRIVVAVMNYWLFDERSEWNQEGWETAEEYGFSTDNRLTVEWVMEHPKEAIEIQSAMAFDGEDFDNWDKVSRVYAKIQNESSSKEEEENVKE